MLLRSIGTSHVEPLIVSIAKHCLIIGMGRVFEMRSRIRGKTSSMQAQEVLGLDVVSKLGTFSQMASAWPSHGCVHITASQNLSAPQMLCAGQALQTP